MGFGRGVPMTDEEVLLLAQGLRPGEWSTLEDTQDEIDYDDVLDDSLISKGLLYREFEAKEHYTRHTPLGARVWAWRGLFWGGA
jgi:hypothetical protein